MVGLLIKSWVVFNRMQQFCNGMRLGGTVFGCHLLRQCLFEPPLNDGSLRRTISHRRIRVLLPMRHIEEIS
jgi:hypothetical protein